jgi:hypothetical protein
MQENKQTPAQRSAQLDEHYQAALRDIAGVDVVSNVGCKRTISLCRLVRDLDQTLGIIVPEKPLVLVDRNEAYLDAIAQKILHRLMPEHEMSVSGHDMPHYLVYENGYMRTYHNKGQGDALRLVARTKHPDSLFEKITRQQAKYGTLQRPDGSLLIEDTYALTLGGKDAKSVDALCEKVENEFDFIVIGPGEKDDSYHTPRKTGHAAVHYNGRWKNGNPALEDIRIELQVTDLEALHYNTHGREDQPQRGHAAYAQDKLAKPHHLGNYQVIIVDASAQIPQEYALGRHRINKQIQVARVEGIFGSYVIVTAPNAAPQN